MLNMFLGKIDGYEARKRGTGKYLGDTGDTLEGSEGFVGPLVRHMYVAKGTSSNIEMCWMSNGLAGVGRGMVLGGGGVVLLLCIICSSRSSRMVCNACRYGYGIVFRV